MTPRLARRRFLQVAGATALLAACGDDGGTATSSGATAGPGATGTAAAAASSSFPVALYSTDRVIAAGSTQRIPFAVFGGPDNTPRRDEALPRQLAVTVTGPDGAVVGTEPVELHGLDLPFPYYPLRTTLPEPGIYELSFDLDVGPSMLVVQAFDPSEVSVVQPGQAMPSVPTPTTGDPLGVDPVCTRFEPCPFHETSLDEVVGQRPVLLLVGTPAYCQTGVCGPVLEQLIAAAPRHPDVAVIHAEVYANPREVDGNLADPAIRTAPITGELGLSYEPVLFVVAADGTLAERLDNVYDVGELESALARLA